MPSKNKNQKSNQNRMSCLTCGKIVKSQSGLAKHVQAMHSATERKSRSRTRSNVRVVPNPTTQIFRPAPSYRRPGVLSKQLDGMTLGTTAYGSAYCRRYIHPCDEVRSGPMKIPDNINDKSAAIEQRIYSVINAPSATTANWDLQVVSLPFADVPVVMRRRPAGGNWSYWHPVTENIPFPPGKTTLGTVQNVAGGGLAPDAFPTVDLKPSLFTDNNTYRGVARGLTFDLNANALSNQGFIMAAQWGSKPYTVRAPIFHPQDPNWFDGSGTTSIPAYLINHQPYFVVKDIPNEPSELMAKVGGACEWKSTEGFYMPIHYEDPTHLYPEYSSWNIGGGEAPVTGGCPIALSSTDETGAIDIDVQADCVYTPDTNPESGRTCITTCAAINQMVGCVIFSGLDKSASIILKVISDYELIPTEKSSLAPATTDAPATDPAAMSFTQDITRGLPMGFPAKYNNLGLIMNAVKPLIRPAMQVAMPWLADRMTGRVRNVTVGRGVPYV